MWERDPESFARRYGVTLEQAAQFRCTAEHLKAVQDGGRNTRWNIVAACQRCNHGRHCGRAACAPSPKAYRAEARRLVASGQWTVVLPG